MRLRLELILLVLAGLLLGPLALLEELGQPREVAGALHAI